MEWWQSDPALTGLEPSYAPTSAFGSPVDRLGEPTAQSPVGDLTSVIRTGGTPANYTLEQRNMYNAYMQC